MTDIKFDKEQAERINEYLTPERQKELIFLITRHKHGKDGFILDLDKFDEKFVNSYKKCFSTYKDYQRICLKHTGNEDFDYPVDHLLNLGFKETDIVLVNN